MSESFPDPIKEELRMARIEAESLAVALWKKHFKEDSPGWELCASVPGIISQINNMVCGLIDPRLDKAKQTMLAVLEELEETSEYWGEYDVPCGIVGRIKEAIRGGRGE